MERRRLPKSFLNLCLLAIASVDFALHVFVLIEGLESCLQTLHKEPDTIWHGQGDSVGREALVEGQEERRTCL